MTKNLGDGVSVTELPDGRYRLHAEQRTRRARKRLNEFLAAGGARITDHGGRWYFSAEARYADGSVARRRKVGFEDGLVLRWSEEPAEWVPVGELVVYHETGKRWKRVMIPTR